MHFVRLDHVNIRTQRLAQLRQFYVEALGLMEGKRPDFSFPGAWLYLGAEPIIHLIEASEAPEPPTNPQLQHFAIRGEGLGDFLSHLRSLGVAYRIGVVPGFGTYQVNIQDPDGNCLHLDFAAHEQADISNFAPPV